MIARGLTASVSDAIPVANGGMGRYLIQDQSVQEAGGCKSVGMRCSGRDVSEISREKHR